MLQRQAELKRQLDVVDGNLASNRFQRRGGDEEITKLPDINQNGQAMNI